MSLFAHIFERGGVLMYPLLVVSIVIWFMIIRRMFQLRAEPMKAYRLAQGTVDAYQSGGLKQCREFLRDRRGLVAAFLRDLFSESPSRGQLDALTLEVEDKLRGPRDYLHACIAAAPLLGLLGTVLGMLETFHIISLMGSSSAQAFSGGISQALITTQAGLAVSLAGIFGNALIEKSEARLHSGLQRARLIIAQIVEEPS